MSRVDVEITFYLEEIMHDIRSKVYQLGKSLKSSGTDKIELAALLQDAEDEDADILLRSVTTSYKNLNNYLSEYMFEGEETANNIMIEETETGQITTYHELHLTLSLPKNYNLATRETISTNAHDYMVNKAISSWLEFVNLPQMAAEMNKQAEASIQNVMTAINKRVRPTRIPISKDEASKTLKYE